MFKDKRKKNKKENLVSGFTLVETMVAVFILSLTIISLMTVVANSLFASRYSRDEITVNYLLQEAVDYVRNDRDSYILLSDAPIDETWQKFINKYAECSVINQGCTIDVFESMRDPYTSYIKKCDNVSEPEDTTCRAFSYKPNSDGSYYNYNSDEDIGYKRKIEFITSETLPNEIIVKATVYWLNGDALKSRSLQTSLLKW